MKLSNKNIAESVEKIEKFFESANVSHKDKFLIYFYRCNFEISLDAIGLIMLADVFIINMSGVIGLIIRNCDLLDFSRNFK